MTKTFYDGQGNMATIQEVELFCDGKTKKCKMYELSKYSVNNDNYLYFRNIYMSIEKAMDDLNMLYDTWKEQ